MAHQGERSTALAPFFPSPGHLAWPPRLATLPSLSDPLQPVDQQGLTWTTPLAPLQRELTCRTSLAVPRLLYLACCTKHAAGQHLEIQALRSPLASGLNLLNGAGGPDSTPGINAHKAPAANRHPSSRRWPRRPPRRCTPNPVPSEAPFTPTALFRHPPCPCPYLTPPALSSAPW